MSFLAQALERLFRVLVAGLGGLLVPPARLGVIHPLEHALAVFVQAAQVVHGDRVASVSGLLITLTGLAVILGDAFAVPVQPAQVRHGFRVSGSGGLLIPRRQCRVPHELEKFIVLEQEGSSRDIETFFDRSLALDSRARCSVCFRI
jgi:hypothetical protein